MSAFGGKADMANLLVTRPNLRATDIYIYSAYIYSAPVFRERLTVAKRTMKITYVDDSREVCSPTDQRQITIAGPVIAPITRPKRMERIQTNPAIYGKLATVKCAII